MSLLSLSNDILLMILSCIDSLQDLSSLECVNHLFSYLVPRILYKEVDFPMFSEARLQSFACTIHESAELARLVHTKARVTGQPADTVMGDRCHLNSLVQVIRIQCGVNAVPINVLFSYLDRLQIIVRQISGWDSISWASISAGLEPSKDTLVELRLIGGDLPHEINSFRQQDNTLLDLRGFSSLKTLEVHSTLVLGISNLARPDFRHNLHERLPTVLENLEIIFDYCVRTSRGWLPPEDDACPEVDCLMDLARHKHVHLPKLASVCVSERAVQTWNARPKIHAPDRVKPLLDTFGMADIDLDLSVDMGDA